MWKRAEAHMRRAERTPGTVGGGRVSIKGVVIRVAGLLMAALLLYFVIFR
jgi:hypothetical protein